MRTPDPGTRGTFEERQALAPLPPCPDDCRGRCAHTPDGSCARYVTPLAERAEEDRAAVLRAARTIVLGSVIPELVEWARTGDTDAQDRAVAMLEDNR